jgi:hypothetical protein
LNWLHSQDKAVYAAGTSNLPWWCKKCVSAKGEYLEKDHLEILLGIFFFLKE